MIEMVLGTETSLGEAKANILKFMLSFADNWNSQIAGDPGGPFNFTYLLTVGQTAHERMYSRND